jgi:hypothetical protein
MTMTNPAHTANAYRPAPARPRRRPTDEQNRAGKALATAEAIDNRVTSLIKHLAQMDSEQIEAVAEPILTHLATATINELHTLFEAWAADQPDVTADNTIVTALARHTSTESSTDAHPDYDTRRLGDTRTTTTGEAPSQLVSPADGLDTDPPQPRPEPDQPNADERAAVTAAPTAPRASHGSPADAIPQPIAVPTVADLIAALRDLPPDTPIRLNDGSQPGAVTTMFTDGQLWISAHTD